MKDEIIKILFFGDIVGRKARNKIISVVNEMREEFGCDCIASFPGKYHEAWDAVVGERRLGHVQRGRRWDLLRRVRRCEVLRPPTGILEGIVCRS